jgi:hypothetical protein
MCLPICVDSYSGYIANELGKVGHGNNKNRAGCSRGRDELFAMIGNRFQTPKFVRYTSG